MTIDTITPNRELLLATLHNIKMLPEQWNQSQWRCGAQSCYAGQAALLAGAKWALPDDRNPGDYIEMPAGSYRVDRPTEGDIDETEIVGYEDVTYLDDGGFRVYETVRSYARRALGLDREQASLLFAGDNTLRQLDRIVNNLASASPTEES